MKKLGNKRSGIYAVQVNDKYYVGKDHNIQKQERIKEHLNALKRNRHYNKEMQESYNNNNNFEAFILQEFDTPIDDKELCELEIKWIKHLDSYNNGWNKTLGGIGGNGLILTDEERQRRSERTIGDKNPMSKLSLEDFLEMIQMFYEGHNNNVVAEKFGLHQRYVSLIRNKSRYKAWFREYAPDYEIQVIDKKKIVNRKLTNEEVIKIYTDTLTTNKTNVELGREYDVDPTTISRIRTKKTYRELTDKVSL